MVSTSARNPNESYAERAKKGNTSSASRTTQQDHPQQTGNAIPAHPSSSVKPSQVNVWAERIKEQQANAAPQPAQVPRQRATSSPQSPRDDPIQPRSPPSDLSGVQLAILDQQDEHDPFVIRVPAHLSRQSSPSTNPLPTTDPNAWPLPGAAQPSNATSAGHDSPFLSAAPSRQNSTASVRHHVHSSSGSTRLSWVQSSSQHSRSASNSRTQSRSGSSTSSPRLQIRGRTLPHDDPLPADLRLDQPHLRASNQPSSPALPDPPNQISSSFQIDPVLPPTDPSSYYRGPPVPPLQEMPPHYAHNFVPQYAIPPHFSPAHVPGHASPPYIPPHSGQGTPPYPHYPPYLAYMYGHSPFFWGDIPSHSHIHFQTQPSNTANTSEHAVLHKMEFGSISPVITTESGASKPPAQSPNGFQPRPSKSVVFGTINPAEPQDAIDAAPPEEQQTTATSVEQATEQLTTFSIGLSPDAPGPSRHASRKSSVRSLTKSLSPQPPASDGAKGPNNASPPSREMNGFVQPIKWEFGTTLSGDLDDPQTSPPSPTSLPPSSHQSKRADDQPDLPNVPPSQDTSQTDRSMDKSETASSTSDVWVVKDYGYGFGGHTGSGSAPDVVRWEMHEREKERARESQDREMHKDQYRDRGWSTSRQPGWRYENGVDEERDSWEQQVRMDAPRHMRPRRGSFSGHGGHERGGFAPRRGRGFGGRFHGARGRGGFFQHQRPGSYPFVPPPPPLPPFEMLAPALDTVDGYGPYAPPEFEPYEAVPPPQPRVPFTQAAYSIDAMRNCLLGQLEYYLSPQNMAQDFYLRQRMDSEGWIPIPLLASFKRVQQLHTDADIVRDVLSRSTVVEVSGDWVRMGGRQWEVFVLPNAPRSIVTRVDRGEENVSGSTPYHEGGVYEEHGDVGEHGEIEGDDCEGDEDEDDVEFVIGEEAEGSWMPVPERKQ